MRKHIVTIEETITKCFEVFAENLEEALAYAEKKYKDGEFVLDPGEVIFKQISACDENGDCCDWYEF